MRLLLRGDTCPFDGGRVRVIEDQRTAIAGFSLEAEIGRGAIATVYRSRAPDGARVALKVLDPKFGAESAMRERFLREARAVARLAHPGVARIFGAGTADDGAAYLVMELLAGGALREASRADASAVRADAWVIGRDVARALRAAHTEGVIHRDLKLENVFLVDGGPSRTKLLDFGLASVRGEPGLTATGELIGTPATMAPEQIEGSAPTAAIDLYALGCVLFELVEGRPPFQGSAAAVLDCHVSAPAPLLGDGASDALRSVVASLLSKAPAGRSDGFEALLSLDEAPKRGA
ncbi:MAG: serine/threonine-protein kinase [Polyangiaceae bacterium]